MTKFFEHSLRLRLSIKRYNALFEAYRKAKLKNKKKCSKEKQDYELAYKEFGEILEQEMEQFHKAVKNKPIEVVQEQQATVNEEEHWPQHWHYENMK